MRTGSLWLALALWSAAVGCNGSNEPPLLSNPTDAGEDVPQGDATPVADAGGVDVGLGIGFTEVPDTPCVPKGGATVTLYPPPPADGGDTPAFDLLLKVQTRRVAEGAGDEGFVTFDSNGKNPSASPTALAAFDNRVGSTGQAVVLAGTQHATNTSAQVVYQLYDATGAPLGNVTSLAPEFTQGLAVGGGEGLGLVTWGTPSGVRGAGIGASGGPAGAAFDVALTHVTGSLTTSIADEGSGLYAVAFSGDDGFTTFETVLGHAATSARVADPVLLFAGSRPRSVTQLVKTPSGFALLLSAAGAGAFAGLVLLDGAGSVVGAGHALEGTILAYGVAAQGTELGLLALRRGGEDSGPATETLEFRPFDASGQPLGPWVCLDGPTKDPAVDAAIDADGTGYAVLYRAADGSEVLTRFDHLGTGGP